MPVSLDVAKRANFRLEVLVNKGLGALGYELSRKSSIEKHAQGRWALARSIYQRYQSFTMIPFEYFATNLFLCMDLAPADGCFIECGVWRGGMSAGIADVLPNRTCHLFDSFEGLPPAREIDGSAALEWQSRVNSPIYYDNCRAERSFAERAMAQSAARECHIVQGSFSDTLNSFRPHEPIAVLRLDGDWDHFHHQCLNALFPHVMPGGLIIVDDYYTWDGCTRAVHDYLSRNGLCNRISQADGRVCFIQK